MKKTTSKEIRGVNIQQKLKSTGRTFYGDKAVADTMPQELGEVEAWNFCRDEVIKKIYLLTSLK